MSCIDLKLQFLSHITLNPHQSSYWNQPQFMKSSNQALAQIQTLHLKIKQFSQTVSQSRLRSQRDLQNKMLHNLNENMKICENHLKRLGNMQPDMKCSDGEFLKLYKNSVLTTIEMKLLQAGAKFKTAYQRSRTSQTKNKQNPTINTLNDQNVNISTPNLNRPLFIEQTQQQLMEQVAQNQYKSIQKSIAKISEMYIETASMVRMQQLMVDSIVANIDQTEGNVDGGRKHLTQAHRRQSKNRKFIYKIFTVLYVTVTVYIVILL